MKLTEQISQILQEAEDDCAVDCVVFEARGRGMPASQRTRKTGENLIDNSPHVEVFAGLRDEGDIGSLGASGTCAR